MCQACQRVTIREILMREKAKENHEMLAASGMSETFSLQKVQYTI
jgi:hypothetical protein